VSGSAGDNPWLKFIAAVAAAVVAGAILFWLTPALGWLQHLGGAQSPAEGKAMPPATFPTSISGLEPSSNPPAQTGQPIDQSAISVPAGVKPPDPPADQFLAQMKTAPNGNTVYLETVYINGVRYVDAIRIHVEKGCDFDGLSDRDKSFGYQLDGRWTTFSTMISLRSDSGTKSLVDFYFSLNGRQVKHSTLHYGEIETVSLNVSGAGRLDLRVVQDNSESGCVNAWPLWADAKLTP
jgi:hypothetical protein